MTLGTQDHPRKASIKTTLGNYSGKAWICQHTGWIHVRDEGGGEYSLPAYDVVWVRWQ